MVFTSSRIKQGINVSFNSKKSIFITFNFHLNGSWTNNSNTSNSDDVIDNSNIPRVNVHIKIALNKLINFQKNTDIYSSTGIND